MFCIVLNICYVFCLHLCSCGFPEWKTQDVALSKCTILAANRCYYQSYIVLRCSPVSHLCFMRLDAFVVLQQPCLISIMYVFSTQLTLYFLDSCMLLGIDAFRFNCYFCFSVCILHRSCLHFLVFLYFKICLFYYYHLVFVLSFFMAAMTVMHLAY